MSLFFSSCTCLLKSKLSFWYLCIHEEVPHQGHGLLHCLLLRRTVGRLLWLHGLGSSHHEACNLVIQAVQRLHS